VSHGETKESDGNVVDDDEKKANLSSKTGAGFVREMDGSQGEQLRT
jgi:hypothetical protein